jgi:uncharacterized protein (TIGR03435 family)
MLYRAAFLLSLSCGLLAQASLEFEAVSIKPAAAEGVPPGLHGGPGTSSPGQINYGAVTWKELVQRAYRMAGYQIAGPPWLATKRFDVVAKLPPGATNEQVSAMFEKLLRERFALAAHPENREMPVYELVVGKNGPNSRSRRPTRQVVRRLRGHQK